MPVTGHLGISLGFHRLLSHRSFETPRPIKYALAVLGTLTLQAGPVTWVALHRLHHQKSDQPDDPHTPFCSLLWAYIAWTLFPTTSAERDRIDRRAKDIARDPMLAFLNDHNWLICLYLPGRLVCYRYIDSGNSHRILVCPVGRLLANHLCLAYGLHGQLVGPFSRLSKLCDA